MQKLQISNLQSTLLNWVVFNLHVFSLPLYTRFQYISATHLCVDAHGQSETSVCKFLFFNGNFSKRIFRFHVLFLYTCFVFLELFFVLVFTFFLYFLELLCTCSFFLFYFLELFCTCFVFLELFFTCFIFFRTFLILLKVFLKFFFVFVSFRTF